MYTRPILYLSDYDLCIRCRDGWACVFYDYVKSDAPYEVRYFSDIVEILRYRYGEWERLDVEPNLICVVKEGEEYCHRDEP